MLLYGRLSKLFSCCCKLLGFPVVLVVKNLPANAGDLRDVGSISGLGRSPAGGHGSPFHYSCLEIPMDWKTWWATVHGVAKCQTWVKQLGMHISMHRNLWYLCCRIISRNWCLSSVCEFPFVQKLLLLSILLNFSSSIWSHSVQCSFLKSLS